MGNKGPLHFITWIFALVKSFPGKLRSARSNIKEEGLYPFLKTRMKRPGKDEMLEGSVISVMFKLGWPMMVATFLRTLYNLVDTFWLGHLPDKEAARLSVTAVGQAWTFVFMMMSLGIGFGVAALALVSQHTGSRDFEEAERDAGQLYLIAIVFSIVVGIIGYFATPTMLDILTGTGESAPQLAHYGTMYLQIIFLGLPFMFLFFAFTFVLRGWGDTITPMKITAVSVGLNMVVDPLLIFGVGPLPMLGIRGAAIATVSTRGIGTILGMYLLFSGKLGLELKLSYLKPDLAKIKKFLDIGIPASLGRFGSSIGFIILWAIIYRLPNPEVAGAAYGVGNRILNITFLVMGGLAMAMSTMVGQSLGADDEERAEEVTKKGIWAIVILMMLFAVTIFALRNVVIGVFMPGNEEVIEAGGDFLMIFALAMPFFGVFRGVTSILGGSGHTKQQMALSLSRLWGLRLPLVFLFGIYLSLHANGVWLGMALSNVIASGVALVVYKMGWWKEKVIEDKPTSSPPMYDTGDEIEKYDEDE
ncbi:MAG: MATE family efflux transporter [Candidatus Thermoplasmatota archaeon]|nr:MATE family efflux transporter [Candidatus Thermoplasmatota archaeon]